jgi:hypothetical protein
MQGLIKSGETLIGQNAWALLKSPQAGIEPLQVMTVLINELGEQLRNPTLVVMSVLVIFCLISMDSSFC